MKEFSLHWGCEDECGFQTVVLSKAMTATHVCTSWHSDTAACHAMCNECYLFLCAVGAL